MPQSRKEQGLAVFIIGLAILLASAFDPIRDLYWTQNGESANAELVRHEQYKKSGPKRLVGIYTYKDSIGSTFEVSGKTIYDKADEIPKSSKVAWKLGEPHNGRLLGDYPNRSIPIIIGALVMLWGGYIFVKSKKDKE